MAACTYTGWGRVCLCLPLNSSSLMPSLTFSLSSSSKTYLPIQASLILVGLTLSGKLAELSDTCPARQAPSRRLGERKVSDTGPSPPRCTRRAGNSASLNLNMLSLKKDGASLVVQWLRICLPMQGTLVRALVWERSRMPRSN